MTNTLILMLAILSSLLLSTSEIEAKMPKYKTQLSKGEYQDYKKEITEILAMSRTALMRAPEVIEGGRDLEAVKFKGRLQTLRAKFGMNPRPNIWEKYTANPRAKDNEF